MTCLESTTILTLKTFKSFVPIQLFMQFLCQTKVVRLSNFFVSQRSSSCPISLSDKSRPVVQFLCQTKVVRLSNLFLIFVRKNIYCWTCTRYEYIWENSLKISKEWSEVVNRRKTGNTMIKRQKTKGQTIFLFYFLCDVYDIRNVWRNLRVIKSRKSKERQYNDQRKTQWATITRYTAN